MYAVNQPIFYILFIHSLLKCLQACRTEFHRRLKVYHAWKAKNNKKSVMDENERVPRSILEEGEQVYMLLLM